MANVTAKSLKTKREQILRIATKHGARNVRVFGSVAKGEARHDSGVDFLVEMEAGRSLFDLARLTVDLEELLRCEVDLVEQKALHWYVRERILEEAVPL